MTLQEDGACNDFCLRQPVMERPQGESFWRVPLTKDTQDMNQACVIQAVTQEGTEDDDGKFPSSGHRKHKNKVIRPHNEEKPPWKEKKKKKPTKYNQTWRRSGKHPPSLMTVSQE